jgi:flagellar biosynthesis anti-sigma factor FlgM
MRIDLNPSIGQTPDPGESNKPGLRSSSGPASGDLAGDVAKLSPDYVRAQVLTEAVNQLPEIRQEKVAALAQLIRSGNYAVTSEQTAAALLSHMAESTAA